LLTVTIHDWRRELQQGVRMIGRQPGTSVIAILAIALGIGLTTTMFSIVQGVMLRGLPFPDSDRIAFLRQSGGRERAQTIPLSIEDVMEWRTRQRVFESLAAYTTTTVTVSATAGPAERLRGARITLNTLDVLRVRPEIGQSFSEDDAVPGAAPVALIGFRLWQTQFGGRPEIVGTEMRLNGVPTTVVGVMPEKFGFPSSQEVWLPQALARSTLEEDRRPRFTAIGRLRPGLTALEASRELNDLARRISEERRDDRRFAARAALFNDEALPSAARATLFAMLIAVLGVMLIACVNVANLQLARAADRAGEFALRVALGAGRWRIIRHSLLESLVLAVAGAVVGLGIAQYGVVYFMGAIANTEPPFWVDVRLDLAALGFVTLITVAAALVAGTAPVLRLARTDFGAVLKDGARGNTGLRLGRFARGLIVVEVTVSCLLLVVSGLMIRSILAATRLEYRFATTDVFYAEATMPDGPYANLAAVARAAEDIQSRLAAVPGIRATALATGTPGNVSPSSVSVEGVEYRSGDTLPRALRIAATASYFDVLGVRMRQGRDLNSGDTAQAPRVAVVDEAFAARYVGGVALGKRIRFAGDPAWLTIVGIVPSLVAQLQDDQIVESIYVPLAQAPQRDVTVLARTIAEPLTLAPTIRQALSRGHPDISLAGVNSLAGEIDRGWWALKLFGGLFLTFGAAAVMLTGTGLFGVMAFSVRQRRQEIGVRMALGASRGGVMWLILRQGLWRVALGIVLGVWPGWFLAGQMQALVAGVSPTDPIVYVGTTASLLIAGIAATVVPALRAASIDPAVTLRKE
jgi:predicted permease